MHLIVAALLVTLSAVAPAVASNDPTYTVTFYKSPGCKDKGAGPFTNPIEDVLCVNAPNAVSVYMDFSNNYGNGVGELIPLQDDTTVALLFLATTVVSARPRLPRDVMVSTRMIIGFSPVEIWRVHARRPADRVLVRCLGGVAEGIS